MGARRGFGTTRGRVGRGLAGVALAAGLVVGGAGVAGAEQRPSTTSAEQTCRSLGGSWRPAMYDGIEGGGCRIDLFYGCGLDIVVDRAGTHLGGDAWCLGVNVSW